MALVNEEYYYVSYETKRGGSAIITTTDYETVVKKLISLFKKHLEATVRNNDIVIGKVWKESKKWNYFLET
jgi:hypothetical protein